MIELNEKVTKEMNKYMDGITIEMLLGLLAKEKRTFHYPMILTEEQMKEDIAVLDLTKMGDLVRSRTYEAFFPLIAVMVIYFILEGILGLCVGIIAKKISPRKKNNGKLLKGVNRHD